MHTARFSLYSVTKPLPVFFSDMFRVWMSYPWMFDSAGVRLNRVVLGLVSVTAMIAGGLSALLILLDNSGNFFLSESALVYQHMSLLFAVLPYTLGSLVFPWLLCYLQDSLWYLHESASYLHDLTWSVLSQPQFWYLYYLHYDNLQLYVHCCSPPRLAPWGAHCWEGWCLWILFFFTCGSSGSTGGPVIGIVSRAAGVPFWANW